MKLTVNKMDQMGSDRGTSQMEHHIRGEIDGEQINIRYIDCGNNAEYDTDTSLYIDSSKKHEDALLAWLDRVGEDSLVYLKAGDSVDLNPPLKKAAKPQKKSGGFKPS